VELSRYYGGGRGRDSFLGTLPLRGTQNVFGFIWPIRSFFFLLLDLGGGVYIRISSSLLLGYIRDGVKLSFHYCPRAFPSLLLCYLEYPYIFFLSLLARRARYHTFSEIHFSFFSCNNGAVHAIFSDSAVPP
jgi:hypothetical protein